MTDSSFVFDTDLFSLYGTGDENLGEAIRARPDLRLQVTVITVEECLRGWYDYLRSSKRPKTLAEAYSRLSQAVRTFSRFEILEFSEEAIARHESLKAARLNIGAMDLKIAAIALEHNCTVVTRNLRDFGRVPGLVVADWSA